MKPGARRRGLLLISVAVSMTLLLVASLSAGSAVLRPRTDSPERVDAIVVVAGVIDDRYRYARELAEDGVADFILVSRPTGVSRQFGDAVDAFCAESPLRSSLNTAVTVSCYTPDIGTTEGETTAATRIAHEMGYDSLLVITYWGHVSRVRLYFEQCFEGEVYVTDTPRPTKISRRYALLHETGGYVKALIKQAC